MQFQQNTTVPLLYTAIDTNNAPVGTLLYLLPSGSTSTPQVISFADSWNLFAGVYLFLAQPLVQGQEQAFVAAAQAFLADPRMQQTRFVWFYPPYNGQLLSGQNISISAPLGNGVTSDEAVFVFRNITLSLMAGATVAIDVTNTVFTFTATGAQGVFLTAANAAQPIYSLGPQLTVPMTGPLAGCLQVPMTLQYAPQQGIDNLADLDIGLRYFYAEAFGQKASPAAGDDGFFLGTMRYPLFGQALTLYANLDPLAALNPARSFFAFNADDAGQTSAQPASPVTSYYSATLGTSFSLLPVPGSAATTNFAALVFAVNQSASALSPGDPYYVVPRGDFQLQSTRSGAVNFMCGLSGVEYLGLNAQQTSVLSFFPGNNAFAFGFQPGEKPGSTNVQPTDIPTTAYATVTTTAQPLGYYAQPDQSVLYNYDTTSTPTPGTLTALAAVPVLAASIAAPATTAPVFPLLPYAGLAGQDVAAYQQLETQVINPTRRQALAVAQARPQVPAVVVAPASPFSTTPQGLLANYSTGEIVLAQMTLPQQGASAPAQLRLENVTGELLTAFQSNKMFLVVSDPTKMTGVLQAQYDQIILGLDPTESWQFDLDPTQWQANGTILIIKFYDLSIADLLGQPSAWSNGNFFNNGSAATTATVLRSLISQADPGDADFASFLNAVNNPNWNGILVMNVHAPLNELPSELAGLAVGIDQSQFRAHHVGINASKINASATPGPISIQPSSIFGLIHYQAPTPLQPHVGDYQFQVEQLKVLFLNSVVAGFSSVIELQINTLFGEPATLANAQDNIVRMYGVYQKHVVNGQTQESYLFQTQTGQASNFNMESGVLNAVQLTKGQFVTVTSQDTATQTVSQFVFWGLLDFKALDGFDLFSFGRESGAATPAGLNFSNLVIDMDFNPTATPPVLQFTFDASQLAFDLAASTARKDSFFKHFPLTVSSFTQATEGTAPTDQGYMGLQSPLTQSSLVYPWYALNFNIDLGSPGALAAKAGFIASLTASWSPQEERGDGTYHVFTGLKLPGSSGSKREIAIEGLFNITFKTLEIIVQPDSDTFILVLYNIGFKFLSFTFPPSGQVNFVLFGNPNQPASGSASLGWYAAYAKPETKKQPSQKTLPGANPPRQLSSAR